MSSSFFAGARLGPSSIVAPKNGGGRLMDDVLCVTCYDTIHRPLATCDARNIELEKRIVVFKL